MLHGILCEPYTFSQVGRKAFPMKLHEMLALDALQSARVVAGANGLHREVRWVHIIDIPEPLPWVQAGQLLLTTGYAWPRDEDAQRTLIRGLAELNLAGVGLAVPHFFEHFSAAACDEADAVALPLIEIPWDVPFAHITERGHRAILAEQYRVIEQSEAIHRKLTLAALEGADLQDLATTLGYLLERAITIEDMEGRILAYYAIAEEEDQVWQLATDSRQTPPDVMAQLEHNGALHQIRHATQPVHVAAQPAIGLKARVACPIRLKEEAVGLVGIIEGERPLSELDMRAAEHAALVAALYIAQQQELNSLEARLGYTFIDALLEGHFESTPHALERARLLGFDPDARYRVGLLVLDEPVPLSREGFLRRERMTDRLRRNFKFLGLAPLISVSLNRICFLLPEKCPGAQIWKIIGETTIMLAFGQLHVGIEGVQTSYRETLSMVPFLIPHSFQFYEQLLLPRVLMGDAQAHHIFTEKLLGPLQRQRNGDVLVETLLTWARLGFHFATAAQALIIHPKTLQYRLAKVAEILTIDLSESEIRFQLQLASHLLSLYDKPIP